MNVLQCCGKRCVVYVIFVATAAALIGGCSTIEGGNRSGKSATAQSFDPEKITKIAVLAREYRGVSTHLIEDEFIASLLGKGYQIASRSDMKLVLDELRFQHSGLSDADAAKIGKMLNVQAVLIVNVDALEYESAPRGKTVKSANMGARLVSVEGAEVLWIARASYPSFGAGVITLSFGEDANQILKSLASRIAQQFPSRK